MPSRDSGQPPANDPNARPRDTSGRFAKRVDPDGALVDYVGAHLAPTILPDPSTIPADATPLDPSAFVAEPFAKWAGEPSSGGMGGSLDATRDDKYDPQKKPGPFTEVGASGLAQYGGFVRDEFLIQLQGNNARKVFREMWDNDPVISAMVFSIQMLIRKTEWHVEPPEAGTVEEIVQERYLERQQQAAERQQGQQQKLMEAQAGLAGNSTSPTRQGPDGKPAGGPMPPKGPQPGMVGGPLSQVPGIHEALPTGAGSPASPTASPTAPGTNAPATPDAPGSNPSGGPAQAAALGGEGGLPGQAPSRMRKARDFFTRNAPPSDGQDPGQDSGQAATNPLDPGSPGSTPTSPTTGMPGQPDPNAPIDPTDPNAQGPAAPPRDQHAEEMAVYVETCLHDMSDSWSDELAQIITMIVFGFSFHEITYKKRNGPNPDFPDQGSRFSDGKIGWASIAGRAQETLHRWEFDEHGNVIGFWQLAPPKFRLRYIPMSKALLFRTTSYKNNPEGRSVLRGAYRPWFFKKRIEEYEAIGVERNLAGLPVAYVPYQYMTASATPQEQAALGEIKKIVRNLRRNEQEGVVFPAMYDPDTKQPLFKLELLSGDSRQTGLDTDKIITRYEQRIAMNALADFIIMGHDSVGSHALGQTKFDGFTMALEAWLEAIADVFNTYAIPRLMQMNGEDPAESPKLTFGKISEMPLEQVAQMITALSGAGCDLFPDTQLEDSIRERMSWPPKAASDSL